MELKKRKYKRQEVVAILDAYRRQYESVIAEQKDKIIDLAKDKTELSTEVENYKAKEHLITLTLERAEKTAQEIKEQIELEYSLEIERLKNFSQKWDAYFSELKEKYPLYPVTKKALEANEKVKNISKNDNPKTAIEALDKVIGSKKKQKFNPKEKIGDYIAATSDNGFNLDEVLNPGKLRLEDICKELGLIEENE